MKALISGVAGLFGMHTLEEIKEHPQIEKIYGIEDFSRGYPSENKIIACNWGDKVEIKKQRFQDLTSKDIDYMDVDVFIHLAGYTSGKESMNTAEEYFLNNEYGAFQLAQKLLRTKKKPHLIYVSTIEVAGAPTGSTSHGNPLGRPLNTYAVTKLAAEHHIYAQHIGNSYPATIMRFTNTFGENQNIFGFKSVISSFIDRALRHEPLIIYGSGEQKRDFLYVKDAVKAIAKAIFCKDLINGYCLEVGTGQKISINDLAIKIKELTQSSSEIISLPGEKNSVEEWQFDTSIAKEVLRWEPKTTLEEGLINTINWHKCLKSI